MDGFRRGGFGLVSRGLGLGIAAGLVYGCDPGDVASQCGLDVDCTAGGFAEGKASISGVASIDAFFGAAIDLEAAMTGLSGELRAELDAIGASVGVAPGASGADLKLALEQHIAGYVEGSLRLSVQPAKCQASVEASVSAAAECDAEVDPGEVSAKCSGSCRAEAGVDVQCEGDARLMCSGTAPQLDCSTGTCSGTCTADLSVAAECDGTCRGTCHAEAGAFEGFEGRCDGTCEGECAVDMSAGGQCDVRCEGSCDYEAPEGGCEASATARCEAMAGAAIECDAGCEGNVEPPSVSAECEATVEAKASASLQCTPPTIAFQFAWAGGVQTDLNAQAEFRAWLEGFRLHFGAILAARAKAEIVAGAATRLIASAGEGGALLAAVKELAVDGSLNARVGAGCALKEVPVAFDALSSAGAELSGSLGAAVEVAGAFGS
jgi:hypothetical protein